MITTADAPTWLRRSDQAVTWARHHAPTPPRRRHRLRDNRSAGGNWWQGRIFELVEKAQTRAA